jgi:hypothetical protein
LRFEVEKIGWLVGATENGLKFGAFGFFVADFICDERFVGALVESDGLQRCVLVKEGGESGIKLVEVAS